MENQPNDINIIKRGDNVIYATFHRSITGISVSLMVQQGVEKFFQDLSGGSVSDVKLHGPYWSSVNQDPLTVYDMNTNLQPIRLDSGLPVRFDKPGKPILAGDEGYLNLSYLRLVGASKGLRFNLRGVWSMSQVFEIRDLTAEALRKFYKEYLKPIDMIVIVSTQDVAT